MEAGCELPSGGYKLVPWLNWDEWKAVKDSLFSNSPNSVAFAFSRIGTWRSRGNLPVVIDVTSSIVEIQHMDPFFANSAGDAINSEQMLAMLYCMGILRLVNCVVEKSRKKTEISIGEAADAIGIPRILIDIRHEGSHRDLPSLPLVRDASVKAISWLRNYYWDPQEKQIQLHRNGVSSIRKEIRSQLWQLVSFVNHKNLESSSKKVKNSTLPERLCGRSKLITLMASKSHSSKSKGCKKFSRNLKHLRHLYGAYPSEVLQVLLDFLKRSLESPDPIQNQLSLDGWKAAVMKIAEKEPEITLTLLKGVLDAIESETGKNLTDESFADSAQASREFIKLLPSLINWLIEQLQNQKSEIQNSLVLRDLVKKCFSLTFRGNRNLLDAGLTLARLMGAVTSSLDKLKKLSMVSVVENADTVECVSSSRGFSHEELLKNAEKKVQSAVRTRRRRGAMPGTNSCKWVLLDSWNSCPIGMLPRELGSAGRLPNLSAECVELGVENLSEKRGADVELVSGGKRARNHSTCRGSSGDGVALPKSIDGCLLVNGLWKKVEDDEIASMESRLRILV